MKLSLIRLLLNIILIYVSFQIHFTDRKQKVDRRCLFGRFTWKSVSRHQPMRNLMQDGTSCLKDSKSTEKKIKLPSPSKIWKRPTALLVMGFTATQHINRWQQDGARAPRPAELDWIFVWSVWGQSRSARWDRAWSEKFEMLVRYKQEHRDCLAICQSN